MPQNLVVNLNGTLGGQPFTGSASILFTAVLDPTKTTISVSPATVPADGHSTAVVTVRTFDRLGQPWGQSAGVVTLSDGTNSLAVTDSGDGTYIALCGPRG